MASFERCVVMVADDEPSILRLVSNALTRHGYEVIPASDGGSALQSCEQREGPIHLALLDVIMPGMTGPELYRHLREIHPKISVLFMSGYGSDQLVKHAPELKDAHFIAKPFMPKALVQRVNEILGNVDVCVPMDDEVEVANF